MDQLLRALAQCNLLGNQSATTTAIVVYNPRKRGLDQEDTLSKRARRKIDTSEQIK